MLPCRLNTTAPPAGAGGSEPDSSGDRAAGRNGWIDSRSSEERLGGGVGTSRWSEDDRNLKLMNTAVAFGAGIERDASRDRDSASGDGEIGIGCTRGNENSRGRPNETCIAAHHANRYRHPAARLIVKSPSRRMTCHRQHFHYSCACHKGSEERLTNFVANPCHKPRARTPIIPFDGAGPVVTGLTITSFCRPES